MFVHCLPMPATLFFGISERLMNRLQSVQNAAARLRQLHWLPVRQHVNFKVATLCRSLHGISPSYIAYEYDCRLVADAREWRLRSTVSRTCVVTRAYSTFGDRAFAAAGRGLWNSLPSHLKEAIYRTTDSGGCWRHHCLDSGISGPTVLWELF